MPSPLKQTLNYISSIFVLFIDAIFIIIEFAIYDANKWFSSTHFQYLPIDHPRYPLKTQVTKPFPFLIIIIHYRQVLFGGENSDEGKSSLLFNLYQLLENHLTHNSDKSLTFPGCTSSGFPKSKTEEQKTPFSMAQLVIHQLGKLGKHEKI